MTRVVSSDTGVLGPNPVAVVTFAVLALLAEARPVTWLSRQEGSVVTASWTFSVALLATAPLGTALVLSALISGAVDLFYSRPFNRGLFNAANIVVSLSVAAWLMHTLCDQQWVHESGARVAWWAVTTLVAGAVAIVVNTALTCIAVALNQRLSALGVLRAGLMVNLTLDGLMLALAPVFVLISQRSLLLAPLLLVTVWTIYTSGHLALRHRHDAIHDMLTGLPNRRHFVTQGELVISAARRHDYCVAIVHLDLNHFKAINDRLGHHVGDRLLCEAAQRLRHALRNGDLLARLGGDEFAVILTDIVDARDAVAAVRRLHGALSAPVTVEEVPVELGGSFGIALFPDHGDSLKEVLDHADVAMYSAKANAEGVRVYEPEADDCIGGRRALVVALPSALRAGQLRVEFQPRVSVATGRVTGAEALLRWNHPVLGEIGPERFIDAAAETEVIRDVTTFVLHEALGQLARWRAGGFDFTVAVNVTARSLLDPKFVSGVEDLLVSNGVSAAYLELEVTERAVLSDPARMRRALARLREVGVRVSLDDFGTGYSSLSLLRSLPLDRIKLDPSFVGAAMRAHDDAPVVRTVIDLAHQLHMATTGEGVEDAEMLKFLRDAGCDDAQGYLFSPATSAGSVVELARASDVTA